MKESEVKKTIQIQKQNPAKKPNKKKKKKKRFNTWENIWIDIPSMSS